MPKLPLFAVAACLLACALPARADGVDQQAAYERLRSLAGEWAGRMEDPLAGPPATVRFELVSGGQAVVAHQNEGQSYESVIVYALAGGRLRATLYSGAGNQPSYRLDKESTPELLRLVLDGGTGFDPDRDGHVRRGEIRFVSPDRIEERWFHYVGSKEQGVTHWFLDRVVPTMPPAVPAAPEPAKTPPPDAAPTQPAPGEKPPAEAKPVEPPVPM